MKLLSPSSSAIIVFSALALSAIQAQSLPANYKTIFENADVLVMRVHYGPHEVVPMHDHSAYPTVFVYLNDSGEVRIDHAPPNVFSVTRPPTHTGAFRIAPGMTERHSITNLSDLPSDFLRVELKSISPQEIKDVFRGEVPSSLIPGIHTEFKNADFRIDRIVCPPTIPCDASPIPARSLLIGFHPIAQQTTEGKGERYSSDINWRAYQQQSVRLLPGTQSLRIIFLSPENSSRIQ